LVSKRKQIKKEAASIGSVLVIRPSLSASGH
jgi:hypothetical protein